MGRECEACGVDSGRRRFCSDRCRCWARLHPGEKRATGRLCLTCGASIDHKSAHAAHCDRLCHDRYIGRRLSGPLPRRACGACGEDFTPWRRDQMGCSTECGNQISWRLHEQRRRVARRSGTALPFTDSQLRQRLSMWSGCWLCGGPKQQVDHVKPLAAGGPHMLSNLRPACAKCNRAKGATWPLAA